VVEIFGLIFGTFFSNDFLVHIYLNLWSCIAGFIASNFSFSFPLHSHQLHPKKIFFTFLP
jgi:hypothetical protein